MAANNIHNKRDADLSELARLAYETVSADLAGYGVSPAQAADLLAATDDFDADLQATFAAVAALKAAHSGKRASRERATEALAVIVNVLYNNPAVTPEMLANAGLALRQSRGTKVVPQAPTELLATPSANGTVDLRWNRNGNPDRVSFLVETSTNGAGDWAFLACTGKTRLRVQGFAPGVEAWFRIRATKNDVTSLPSNAAPIYAGGSERRFAA